MPALKATARRVQVPLRAPIFIGDNVMVFNIRERVKRAVLYLKQKTVVLRIDSHPLRSAQTRMVPYQYVLSVFN